jgi:4-amino-4-deoxy-L-arabinose transferase-like glycosyltransferase
MMFKLPRTYISLLLIFLLGLGLRLVVWRWREYYPLGGDEQEYLGVALTMLRERRYEELLFMRPPLYPIFLAGTIYLFDSLVQNLRLVQALISAATIPFVYLLTSEISLQSSPAETHHPPPTIRAAPLAALLAALCYTLAANATELLSETLFLFGLTIVLWLLLRAGRLGGWRWAALAGLVLGALCLVRSVALPLLPLGALWLLLKAKGKRQKVNVALLLPFCLFTFAFCLVILPWTARNYMTYGGLILIDTTGAENLWLDNDPAGREAVKAQLFALGDDRLARQQLAAAQGQAAILADPARFLAKAQAELLKLFALEYSDDMLARPAIWLPPAEVWARLLLGDGLWLLILLAGGYGLGRVASDTLQALVTSLRERKQIDITKSRWRRLSAIGYRLSATASPGLLLGPWALYIMVTALIFHVELRYRLPLYPVLLPYAAIALAGEGKRQEVKSKRLIWRWLAAGLLPFTFCLLTLLHAPYPALAAQLGGKHLALAAAERSLAQGDAPGSEAAAARALAADEGSALARVALARAALLRGDAPAAEALLREASAAIPRHPHAHLLLGDLLRQRGELEPARAELAFESGSLQDLQSWAWERFASPPPAALALGDGLDLGFLRGFHPVGAGEQGYRWTQGSAALRLSASAGGDLLLRLASGRPDGAATALQVLVNGQPLATLSVAAEWQEYRLPLPPGAVGALTVELRSVTFAPRSFDRASPDGRQLGVMVDGAQVAAEALDR